MKKYLKFDKIKDVLKYLFSDKKRAVITGFILAVFAIFFIFTYFEKPSKKAKEENKNYEISVTEYSQNIENKLENMLLNLSEIKSVSVMVMVESTPKIEYLTESQNTITPSEKGTSSTSSTTVVFEKNGTVSTPVVITTIMPKVTGVLIVLNNVSASTKINIINSISVVLNVDSSCISIIQES